MGTGTYGQNNPTIINCGFNPKQIFFYIVAPLISDDGYISKNGGAFQYTLSRNTPKCKSRDIQGDSVHYFQENLNKELFFDLVSGGPSFYFGAFTAYDSGGNPTQHFPLLTFSPSDESVSFYTDDYLWHRDTNVRRADLRNAAFQLNQSGITYYYVAIG